MADNLHDGEFWLPPQFLTDEDDDDTSFCNNLSAQNYAVSRSLFVSSASSETESDEEDHLAELTRRVALELDLNNNNSAQPKGVFGDGGGGSPQSTLSVFGSSGKGSSPNGAVPPHVNSSSTWDLLRAAAGEVERICDESCNRYGHNFLTPSPVAAAVQQSNAVNSANGVGLGFYPQQQQHQQQPSLSHQQLQIAQFEMMMKQQQQQRQMVPPNRGRNNNVVTVGNVVNGLGLSSSAWVPPHGSGMRAVFLAGRIEKSTGTGVFLPRCVDTRNNNDSRKKPGCITMLVPHRVAQALNLNLDGVVGGGYKQQHKPRFIGENGSAVSRVRSNNCNNNNNNHYGYSRHQKRNNMKLQQPQVVNHEIQLPQEWTY